VFRVKGLLPNMGICSQKIMKSQPLTSGSNIDHMTCHMTAHMTYHMIDHMIAHMTCHMTCHMIAHMICHVTEIGMMAVAALMLERLCSGCHVSI
jgi:hypothetical protein